MARVRVTKSRG